jgi:chromosome segregation ATPase
VLQSQLESERAKRESVLDDTTSVREQLDSADNAIAELQQQSAELNGQLHEARRTLASVNPVDTEVGRRWLWLITALILLLGMLVGIAALLPR